MASEMSPLTMYIVVRKDLLRTLQWPLGAVAAQCCHASTAAVHRFYSDPQMQEYLKDLDHMHKVVLEVKNEGQLERVAQQLDERRLKFVLWREQPENVCTALCTSAYRREEVGDVFKKCQLMR